MRGVVRVLCVILWGFTVATIVAGDDTHPWLLIDGKFYKAVPANRMERRGSQVVMTTPTGEEVFTPTDSSPDLLYLKGRWFLRCHECEVSQNGGEPVSLLFGGDLIFSQTLQKRFAHQSWDELFAGVRPLLSVADIAVANLEGCLSSRGSPLAKEYTFRAPPQLAQVLAKAGFDVLTLANNHALDFGPVALLDTLESLQSAGIRPVGAGRHWMEAFRPVVLELSLIHI